MVLTILREIFYVSELTVSGVVNISPNCTLNKWHPRKRAIGVSCEAIYYLIDNDILVERSGNYETGEVHYTYRPKVGDVFYLNIDIKIYKLLKPTLREVRLDKLGI